MEYMLSTLAADHPWLFTIFTIIGVLRVIFKPLMSLLKQVVDTTPTTKDDEFYNQLIDSQAYKAIAWGVDYLASIKLPGQK